MVGNTQPVALDATRGPSPSTSIQSIERAAALLRAVAVATGPEASATALAEAVNLNRTTAWRILTTLEHERLLVRDPVTNTYSLGFGLIDLAGQAADVALVGTARIVLRNLAAESGETAALALVRDGVLTYVAEVTAGAVVAAGWQGRRVSLHATSTGKVLLAYSDPTQLRMMLGLTRGRRLPRYTSSTITSLTALERELTVVRKRGFAVCRGEFETTAWGVSAPVLDLSRRPVAVVSVWGPGERLTEDRFEPLGMIAVQAAAAISGRAASDAGS